MSFGRILRDASGRLTSDMASARYRLLLPAEYLASRGHSVQVIPTDEQFWKTGGHAAIAGSAVLFSKSFDARNEALARALRAAGRRVYFDICDNHFEHPQLGGHYRRMVELADEIVTSTAEMAQVVRSTCGRAAQVVGDPVENARGIARFEPGRPARLLWFGHPVNFDTLQAALAPLQRLAQRVPLQLTVVTAPVPALLAELARWNREAAPAMTVQFTAWSLAETQRQLAGCDLVIIPSLDNERKNVKSPNRLTETIWAGRLAVAYPIPSYMEFAAFAHIATDLEAALSEVLATPGSHAERIAAGQQYIAGHYSHEAIGRRWEAIFQGAG